MTVSRRELLGRIALLGGGLASDAFALAPTAGEVDSPISASESLLFLDKHMGGVRLPGRLHYALTSEGSLNSAPESIDLTLELRQRARAVEAALILPKGRVALPIEGPLDANPIIPWFLDRDVATMERLTGGQRRHFQRRLRFALAAASAPQAVVVQHAGRDWPAQRVTVQPYLDDPMKPRYAKLAAKRYVFTLVPRLAGQLLAIETVIPGAEEDFAQPLLTESLRFAGLA